MGLISESVQQIAAEWKASRFQSPRDDALVESLASKIRAANMEENPKKPRKRVAAILEPIRPAYSPPLREHHYAGIAPVYMTTGQSPAFRSYLVGSTCASTPMRIYSSTSVVDWDR